MILEHAILNICEGQEEEFEAAFARAQQFISPSPGFQSLKLLRCMEVENKYLLLVGWRSVADHEQGFRGSPAYQEWKILLHHFYDPFPMVEHFQVIHK
jgi:heme-degrading monooxygenase HmoA